MCGMSEAPEVGVQHGSLASGDRHVRTCTVSKGTRIQASTTRGWYQHVRTCTAGEGTRIQASTTRGWYQHVRTCTAGEGTRIQASTTRGWKHGNYSNFINHIKVYLIFPTMIKNNLDFFILVYIATLSILGLPNQLFCLVTITVIVGSSILVTAFLQCSVSIEASVI